MKILHVLAQLPQKTGSGVYFSNVIERFAQFGYEQRALFATQGDHQFDLLPEKETYPLRFNSSELPFPIVGMSDNMPYPSTRYGQMDAQMIASWQAAFSALLQKAKAEFVPDVVILHHLWMLTSLAIEIFPTQVKVGICHNTDLRQAEQQPQLLDKYVTNINQLDAILSLSQRQNELIRRIYQVDAAKIHTIGGGFNEQLFYPPQVRPSNSPIQIFFAAKIEPSKGIFELVQAFELVQQQKPNIHLEIIGNADEANQARLNGLIAGNSSISRLPGQEQSQLAEYMRHSDIFVMPSFFEGLGLMAIESLASGLLVVATANDGLTELLGEKINSSLAIEYVPLPRLHDVDKPFAEDVPAFISSLADKLLLQIERIEQGRTIPAEIMGEIGQHSWQGIIERINRVVIGGRK